MEGAEWNKGEGKHREIRKSVKKSVTVRWLRKDVDNEETRM